MKKPLCAGAQEIYDLRMRNMRPSDEVMIVAIDLKLTYEPTVYCDQDVEYEWAWTRGLDIFLITNSGTDYQRLVKDIAMHSIRVDVWFENEKNGMSFSLWPDPTRINRPRKYWTYRLHPYTWTESEVEIFNRFLRRNSIEVGDR